MHAFASWFLSASPFEVRGPERIPKANQGPPMEKKFLLQKTKKIEVGSFVPKAPLGLGVNEREGEEQEREESNTKTERDKE
jgi:hypothetical protein